MRPSENQHPSPSPGDDRLRRLRHSLAHVLAQAVQQLRPGTRLGFGPAIEDGCYHDFVLAAPIAEEDFPAIERRMRAILEADQPFQREELGGEEALARLEAMAEPYQREHAAELLARDEARTLSFYRNGPFLDLCQGPHVTSTAQIPPDGFRLRAVAGAYWRNDSRNVMMTRIYVWAFGSREELDACVRAHQEAAARDHKKLGRELELFAFDEEIGKGLPLWLPNGTVLREELESLMKELEFEAGYQRVATPPLARRELYERTGHLPYFAGGMFPFMEVAPAPAGRVPEVYCLRPMNCPHHHRIFAARHRSYRELPLRLAEYGQCFRFEESGSVSGLLRARAMCMNDAHIYCSREQVVSECTAVLEMYQRLYQILGLRRWSIRLSTHDPAPGGRSKFVDDQAGWEEAEGLLRQVLESCGLPFVEGPGEAAFYGPKLDFQFRMATGREETASTLQLDFAMSRRLGLRYVGADGADHPPFILHRAPASTHERMVAILIEHFAGAFPTWLAPVQVRVLPVSGAIGEYGRRVVRELRARRVRAELDDSEESLNKRVRNAATRKIPSVVVVGEREAREGTVTLRRRGLGDQQTLPLQRFQDELLEEIAARRLERA